MSTDQAAAREHARQRDGKFGEQHRAEDTTFEAPTPPTATPLERGWFTIAELYDYDRSGNGTCRPVMAATTIRTPSKSAHFRSIVGKFGGHGYVRQATGMAANFSPAVTVEDVMEHAGEKVTMMTRTGNGDVDTRQGVLAYSDGRPVLMAKGSRTKGVFLDEAGLQFLAVEKGYNRDGAMAAGFVEHLHRVPVTEPASLDGIPAEDETDATEASAVFVYDHPGFDGYPETAASGCVFVATDITANGNDPIVNGYFWAPEGANLQSETSSMYWSQLNSPQFGAARLSGIPDIDYHNLPDEAPKDRLGMYTWLRSKMLSS